MISRRDAFSFAAQPPILLGGALCLDFINTVGWRGDPTRNTEFLPSYSELVLWGAGCGVLHRQSAELLIAEGVADTARATATILLAKKLRTELEAAFDPALLKSTNLPVSTAILRTVGELGMLALDADKPRWTTKATAPDLSLPLLPIAISALELATSNKRTLVKRCADRSCAWVFIDETRNHSRRWCSMEDCGNRAKASAHYARQRSNS